MWDVQGAAGTAPGNASCQVLDTFWLFAVVFSPVPPGCVSSIVLQPTEAEQLRGPGGQAWVRGAGAVTEVVNLEAGTGINER